MPNGRCSRHPTRCRTIRWRRTDVRSRQRITLAAQWTHAKDGMRRRSRARIFRRRRTGSLQRRDSYASQARGARGSSSEPPSVRKLRRKRTRTAWTRSPHAATEHETDSTQCPWKHSRREDEPPGPGLLAPTRRGAQRSCHDNRSWQGGGCGSHRLERAGEGRRFGAVSAPCLHPSTQKGFRSFSLLNSRQWTPQRPALRTLM